MKGFWNGLNAKFQIQPQTCCNGLMSFIHKKTRCFGPWRWQTCERKFHGEPNFQKISKKKSWGLHHGWKKGTRNLLAQIGSCGVLWIPSIANVLLLSGGDNKGGYGVVHKVWIKKSDHIPNMIKLARKTLKMNSLKIWPTMKFTPPLLIIVPYCGKADRIWKGEHDLSPVSHGL